MPFRGFECRICQAQFEQLGAECVNHFDLAHLDLDYHISPDVVRMIWHGEQDERRSGEHLSPSLAGGCLREVALKRTTDWWLEPLSAWKQVEGTLYHAALAEHADESEWYVELELPGPNAIVSHGGVSEIELWPGIWLSGRLDRLKRDLTEVRDYKTSSAPKGNWKKDPAGRVKEDGKPLSIFAYYRNFFPPGEAERLQLNLYSLLVERCLGKRPARLLIEKVQKGVGDVTLAFKQFEIEPMAEADLRAAVEPEFVSLRDTMRVQDVQARLERISKMPLTGRQLYVANDGSCACTTCPVRRACDELLPPEGRF